MNSKERILAAINRETVDHIPLYSWCFGFSPPENMRWKKNEKEVKYWYTMRLEHIHTLPQEWRIEDDFKRVKAWLNLGVDDLLDVSLPWSIHPDVIIKDWEEGDILCRSYQTPKGEILQKVKKTEELIPPGWTIQPDKLVVFEDFNLPRSVMFPASIKEDLPKLKYLLQKPDKEQIKEFKARVALIKEFADENGIFVQGWSAFGMDGVIWLCGVERAVISAMTEPEFFQELVDIVFEFDLMRTEMLLDFGGIDMIVQRGWYSSTDFWSPELFKKYVSPNVKKLVRLAHQKGVKFGYVITTGVMTMIEDLIDAGVDLIYFADPEGDNLDLTELKEITKGRISVAGGLSSTMTLNKMNNEDSIREKVRAAMETMGERGFILSPVDALFPDTPWENVRIMIDTWKEVNESGNKPAGK